MNKRGIVMNCNVKISYYVRLKRTLKDQQYPIIVRVSHNGDRITLGQIGLSIDTPQELEKNRIAEWSSQYIKGNQYLDKISLSLQMKADELLQLNQFSLAKLKSIYSGKEDRTASLHQMCSYYFDRIIRKEESLYNSGQVTKSTYRKYLISKDNFFSFLSLYHKRSDIGITEITK